MTDYHERGFMPGVPQSVQVHDGFLSNAATRTLIAVALAEPPIKVRAICAQLDRAPSTVHNNLRQLRSAGLVTWDEGHTGTLRSTFAIVRTHAS